MARQMGFIKLSGQIGDIDFYGDYAKKAAKKENYNLSENSKKSATDFGRASTASTAIKNGFKTMVNKPGYAKLIDRIRSLMIRIINTGPVTSSGNRQVEDGDVSLLKKFEFNTNARLSKLINILPIITTDMAEHKAIVNIQLPKMELASSIKAAPNAASIVLEFTCCSFDFKAKKGRFISAADLVLPLSKKTFGGASLDFELEDTKNRVVLIAMGAWFVHKKDFAIMNQEWYASQIIEAVYIRDGEIVPFVYPERPAPVMTEVREKRVEWVFEEDEWLK